MGNCSFFHLSMWIKTEKTSLNVVLKIASTNETFPDLKALYRPRTLVAEIWRHVGTKS